MLEKIIVGIILSYTSVACYQVVQVPSSPLVGVTASIFWDCHTKSVYYGDFLGTGEGPVIFRYDYVTERHYSASIQGYSGPVSDVIPISCSSNHFVAILGPCAFVISWDGYSGTARKLREIFCVDQVITFARADPWHRLYMGTAQPTFCDANVPAQASLYRYERTVGVIKNFDGIKASGGMDWNWRTGQFYYKDMCQYTIMEYQWHPFTGELTNGRSVYQFTDKTSIANAVTIDKSGMLYVPLYNSSSVVKIDPRSSKIVETFVLPASFPTAITFCGPLLDMLCVNTGNIQIDINTGPKSDTPVTANDGKLYIIKDISARGHCDRRICI